MDKQAWIDYLKELRRHLLAEVAATERLLAILNADEICYNKEGPRVAKPEPPKAG